VAAIISKDSDCATLDLEWTMLNYAKLNQLRRTFAKEHGEKATAEIIDKHGGTDGLLGTVPETAWPALAVNLGYEPDDGMKHAGKGRDANSLYSAAYSRWNSIKRRPS
jgi:hypothetical protein